MRWVMKVCAGFMWLMPHTYMVKRLHLLELGDNHIQIFQNKRWIRIEVTTK